MDVRLITCRFRDSLTTVINVADPDVDMEPVLVFILLILLTLFAIVANVTLAAVDTPI